MKLYFYILLMLFYSCDELIEEVQKEAGLELKKQHQGMDNLRKYFEENKIHGHEYYHRVRIMKLAPAGYISIHDDDPKKNKKPWDENKGRPSSLNMCINNPDGCEMHFWNGDFEYVGRKRVRCTHVVWLRANG